MDILSAIEIQDPAWIAIAFIFGLIFKQFQLAPMIGFLAAGFMLNMLGVSTDSFLNELADLGVTLLLFTIGLKLQLKTLARLETWGTATAHMAISVVAITAVLLLLSLTAIQVFAELDLASALIVAFALSFSSTVFAVKVLEERGAMSSQYGRTAIGILVIQDIAAVIFLAASSGKLPSIWAILLLALIPGRHLLGYILSRSGHRELLPLFGFVAALGGAALFEVVGMKGDLGALIFGVLLANHPRSGELAKHLLGFKDVLLVGFFLTIGLAGLPTWDTALAALLLSLLLPFKGGLFYLLLARFKLRARAATQGGAILTNYSEFGLIVAAISLNVEWLPAEWITILALALSFSFLLASPLNRYTDTLYMSLHDWLIRWEQEKRLPEDEEISISGNRILIIGMGRVGQAAYDEMAHNAEGQILGIDLDKAEVEKNSKEGRRVVPGDATHPEFWSRFSDGHKGVEMILLAMPNHLGNIAAADNLRAHGYKHSLVATALYPDQEAELKRHGITEVYNIYKEVGVGAAAHMWDSIKRVKI
ncbi:transporter, CPA2 family [Magnetococcus marinus MC-1]|uniref:Transporter, CPA2 family n=1 Tax=Magnetococcus marinus (strain ATCC BAA-1437 / JCM 17883 / MC-1) TaxID=156889 RepID=A0LAZ3_MAGMM|nr:cation:proton antiporter family protein [Magnetococcus marinus]ABK45136.1 transporter, CPA2 family [Magnetococcus marinus MC-1]